MTLLLLGPLLQPAPVATSLISPTFVKIIEIIDFAFLPYNFGLDQVKDTLTVYSISFTKAK